MPNTYVAVYGDHDFRHDSREALGYLEALAEIGMLKDVRATRVFANRIEVSKGKIDELFYECFGNDEVLKSILIEWYERFNSGRSNVTWPEVVRAEIVDGQRLSCLDFVKKEKLWGFEVKVYQG